MKKRKADNICPDQIEIMKEIDFLISGGKRTLSYKYADIWDADRSINAYATGARQTIYGWEGGTPAERLKRMLECDIALDLAWEVLWDNREMFRTV